MWHLKNLSSHSAVITDMPSKRCTAKKNDLKARHYSERFGHTLKTKNAATGLPHCRACVVMSEREYSMIGEGCKRRLC